MPMDRDRPDRDGTSRLSPHLHWGEISPVAMLAGGAQRHGRRPMDSLDRCRREVPEANSCGANSPIISSITGRTFRESRSGRSSKISRGAAMRRRFVPGSRAAPAIRLSMPACGELWATGYHAQSRAHDRRVLPHQAPARPVAGGREAGSGIRWSMPISPTMPQAGSGSRAAAPMPRPISASSIRPSRPRSSIPRATMSANGCRSWPISRLLSSTGRGTPMAASTTRPRSSITTWPANAHSRR